MPRREFLFDIQFWEARRIIRGHRKRNRLEQQLLRLNAYMSCFTMRDNREYKTPQDWLPLPWEHEEEHGNGASVSEDEANEMLALMEAINQQNSTDTNGGKE